MDELPSEAELRRTAEVLMQVSAAARAAGRTNIAALAYDVAAWVPETPEDWRRRYPPLPPKPADGPAVGGDSIGSPAARPADEDEDKYTW